MRLLEYTEERKPSEMAIEEQRCLDIHEILTVDVVVREQESQRRSCDHVLIPCAMRRLFLNHRLLPLSLASLK
jgi:hypothetical protein